MKLGKYKVSRIQTIADGTVNLDKTKYTNDEVSKSDFLHEGDILFSHINSIEHLAKTAIFLHYSEKVVHGANLIKLKPNQKKILPTYAINIFKSDNFINDAKRFAQKAVNQASINTNSIKKLKIPLPSLEVQEQIVAEVETEQQAIEECKKLIAKMEQKIAAKIDEVWRK